MSHNTKYDGLKETENSIFGTSGNRKESVTKDTGELWPVSGSIFGFC